MMKATPIATMRRRCAAAPPELFAMGHFLRRVCRAVLLSFRFDHYMGCLPFFEARRAHFASHPGRGVAGLVPAHPDYFCSVPFRRSRNLCGKVRLMAKGPLNP